MSDQQQPSAGYPSYPPYSGQAPPRPSGSNGLAIAGFVLGLLALLTSWIPLLNILSIIIGVLGVILAAIGLAKAGKIGSGKGLAIAGLVLGTLAVVFSIVVNVAFVDAVDDAVDEATDTSVDSGDGADGDLGESRDNPAPIGSEITGGDWTVTINSVTTADSDSMGQKPAQGATLLVINMTATYNGDDEQGESAWATVEYVTADGTTIDSTDSFFVPENQFDSLQTVYAGASVEGDQMIEVPADNWQDGVLAVSPDLMADDTFVALD